MVTVLLDRIFVMNAGDESLIGDMKQRHPGGFVDAATFRLDDPVLDLVADAEPVATPDRVRLENERHAFGERDAIERCRTPFLETHGYGLRLDLNILAPGGDTHDRLDNANSPVEELQVLGLVGRAEEVRIGRVGLLHARAIRHTGSVEILRHLLAAAQFADECSVEPRLVDAQARVGEQPVTIEALDVVTLVRAAVAPDVDVVFAHGDHQHRTGDGAAERRRVEIGRARGRDVKGACLQRRDALGDERSATVDELRTFGAVGAGAPGNVIVVGLVGLAEVRRIGVGNGAFDAHPMQRRACIEAARKRYADLLADRHVVQDM